MATFQPTDRSLATHIATDIAVVAGAVGATAEVMALGWTESHEAT